MVRTALYEAANVVLARITKFSKLKRWAMDVANAGRTVCRPDNGAVPLQRPQLHDFQLGNSRQTTVHDAGGATTSVASRCTLSPTGRVN